MLYLKGSKNSANLKIMAKIDFTEIKKEYISTSKSLRDLASEYGVSFSYLSEVSAREGWVDQKELTRTKAGQIMVEKVAETLSEVNIRHTNIWKLIQGESLKKIQEFREAGELVPDETLKSLAQVLKIAIEGERVSLGMPTLGIRSEQTTTIVKDPYEERLRAMTREELLRETEATMARIKDQISARTLHTSNRPLQGGDV